MKVEDIIYEGGPGFGGGHPGFGQRKFSRKHYAYMAAQAGRIPDQHAREFILNWLSDLFLMDNPNFKPDAFKQAAEETTGAPTPSMQARHFHLFAEEVCTIKDPHIREFLQNWLADILDPTNEFFRHDKWEQFCNIGASHFGHSSTRRQRQERRRELNLPDDDDEAGK